MPRFNRPRLFAQPPHRSRREHVRRAKRRRMLVEKLGARVLLAADFSDISAGIDDVQVGSVAWGDYDNDGDLDILLTGQDASSALISRVYRQESSGSFSDISAGLDGVWRGSVAWGDYDNDGDLDILLTGQSSAASFRGSTGKRAAAASATSRPDSPGCIVVRLPGVTTTTTATSTSCSQDAMPPSPPSRGSTGKRAAAASATSRPDSTACIVVRWPGVTTTTTATSTSCSQEMLPLTAPSRGPGNVAVTLSGSSLIVIPDSLDNAFSITPTSGGVIVTGIEGTTINGNASESFTGGVDGQIAGNLQIVASSGKELIIIEDVTVGGSTIIQGGDDKDAIDLSGVTVLGNLLAYENDGDGFIDITDSSTVTGATQINAGEGGQSGRGH